MIGDAFTSILSPTKLEEPVVQAPVAFHQPVIAGLESKGGERRESSDDGFGDFDQAEKEHKNVKAPT